MGLIADIIRDAGLTIAELEKPDSACSVRTRMEPRATAASARPLRPP